MHRQIRLGWRASAARSAARSAAAAAVLLLSLVLLPRAATAGPNANAKLILHHNPSLTFTTDFNQSWDGYSQLYDCKEAVTQVEAQGQGVVFFVLAAFDNFASPNIKAFSFGIESSSPLVTPIAGGPCGGDPFVVEDDGWPANRTGIGLSWDYPLTRQINEIYWFASYAYAGNTIKVVGHPRFGAEFNDGGVPPELDYVGGSSTGGYYHSEYFGMLGFGRKGNNPCNPDQSTGACCMRTGACIIQTRAGCTYLGHTYLGDDTSCRPNPCRPGTGACCIRGECRLMPWDDCTSSGGTFMGDGRGCDPSPCSFGESQSSWGALKTTFRE